MDNDRSNENPFSDIEPVDYKKIGSSNTRVIAIGENHLIESHKDEIIRAIEEFQRMGFTHLALEMVGVDEQRLLDEYLETGKRKDELVDHLREYGYAAKRLQLIDEAHRLGLHVVGLDMHIEENDTRDPLERLFKKDEVMAKTIAGIIQANPCNKVMAFTGSLHVAKTSNNTMAGKLENNDRIPITSVKLVGGENNQNHLLEYWAMQSGMADQRFMRRVYKPTVSSERLVFDPGIDWLIHLPQK